MGRRVQINWEPIKALFIAGRTSRELSIIFGIPDNSIRQKSKKDGWGALRKTVRSAPPIDPEPSPFRNQKTKVGTENVSETLGFQEQSPRLKSELQSENALNRAIRLRSSDQFRERVIVQADKALDALEKQVCNNVFETDRFAEALTKVERIGARAYGYDREGDHPVINIGILGTGAEYESA